MSGLDLEPPAPSAPPARPASGSEVALDASTVARLKAVAREFAGAFVSIDPHSPEFDSKAAQIAALGSREVKLLSDQARATMSRTGNRDGAVTAVHTHLERLRAVVERLDPGVGDELLKPRRLLGLFPSGNRLTSYFDRYRDAEGEIEAALGALAASRDLLLQDNIAIERFRAATWPLLASLAEAVEMSGHLDARFEKLASQLDQGDPNKAQRLRSTALFQARQRHGDLLTQMAVSQQGYAMLGIIQTNNIELIKGIDRASATTIAALQTAIVAAQTLTNQRMVLSRIGGVTAAAGSLLERSAQASADGNAGFALDSAEAAQQVAALRAAFADVTASVDALDGQHRSALSAL
ncbi:MULTISPECIES: toxic anion resistance protein [unclassified Sphingopyxis]|uniref:toxic anion resistance protein n=1 Tax=unclassified Sphingopyxis TaxID=2614943 RepID=UPI000736513F|nr:MULTISPECIES: toxic anion resistance protein [unclassified Sphingopyxis]KTE40068.1 hypothetical protein ATE62_08190 [Sphingopyxis sp. HIX]KTE86010.1 hypothetical protein ATE72_00155 [Sphingopyxis sp. HXXIV]